MEGINMLAVVVSTIVLFAIGALWYSPVLFANAWMKACGFTEKDLEGANMAKIFGTAFVFMFVMTFCLAMYYANSNFTVAEGAQYGFYTGFGWMAPAIGVGALFERRPWAYTFIHGGYYIVGMTVVGAILRAWV